jgi:uroporphyrin-III C-methyltransferase
MAKKARGKVSLVGAGPGDPGLLTLRGLDRIKHADVIIYDRLVSDDVLALIPKKTGRIYGGKDPGSDSRKEQARLNELMVRHAKEGKSVVRLKGGDPFLFSRGGEEAEYLAEHGIDFELVPGISSAMAVPAYAGIPLTHREHSSSVTIVTGRESDLRGKTREDWSRALRGTDSVVILMGAARVAELAKRLLESGRSRSTPVAATTWGTTRRQTTVLLTLGEAAATGDRTAKAIRAPCVLVIGEVATLAPRLEWSGSPVEISRGFRTAWMRRQG